MDILQTLQLRFQLRKIFKPSHLKAPGLDDGEIYLRTRMAREQVATMEE